jgi:CRISPR/Cas system-associated protein Csx1
MDSNRGRYIAIIGGVAVGLLAARALYQMLKKKNEVDTKTAKYLVTKWEPVGKVTSLHIYPIKSCHRVKVDEGYCDVLGLKSGSYLRDR